LRRIHGLLRLGLQQTIRRHVVAECRKYRTAVELARQILGCEPVVEEALQKPGRVEVWDRIPLRSPVDTWETQRLFVVTVPTDTETKSF
jgi:hypothetical protein